jgi:peptidoglycan hydrolase-like protein with peptidoglycan-binding domain
MPFSLIWLPEVLRKAGLKVAEQPGWASRGRGPMSTIRGIICHHTAGARTGNMPSLGIITQGRSDLPGPLAQLGLGRDGTFYVVAAGRANHAGRGVWRGVATGNSSFIGIEAENSGTTADPWPDEQVDAYARGVAAILHHIGSDAGMCCGHKEYAIPHGRKPDPSFDIDAFRARIRSLMNGTAVVRPLVPAADASGRPTLRRGARGEPVKLVQKAVSAGDDGIFGAATEAAVRRFQRSHQLVADGIVGPASWAIIAPA